MPAMMKYSYERLLQWSECDPAGIIFFPHYAIWMAEGLNMALLSVGYSPTADLPDGGMRGLPSVGYTSRFLSAPRLHELVTHEIEVTEIGGKSIGFAHRFLCAGNVVAEAEEKRVVTISGADGSLKSAEIPAELRAALETDAVHQGPCLPRELQSATALSSR